VLPGCLRANDFIELESSSRVFYKRRIIEALQQHARASPHRVLPSRFAPRVFLQLCLSESGDGVSPFGAVAHGRRPKKVGCVSSPSRRFVLSDCSASMSASFEIGAGFPQTNTQQRYCAQLGDVLIKCWRGVLRTD
jgi:hypothetical protein